MAYGFVAARLRGLRPPPHAGRPDRDLRGLDLADRGRPDAAARGRGGPGGAGRGGGPARHGDRQRGRPRLRPPGRPGRRASSTALRDVNVVMISFGASDVNLSFVVAEDDAERAVRLLHREFFESGAPREGGASVGHGQMGREVEAVLRERGHEPVGRRRGGRLSPRAARSASTSRGADAVVAERHGARWRPAPATSWAPPAGTTHERRGPRAGRGRRRRARLRRELLASGVNLFYRIVREAAALLAPLPRLRPLHRSSGTTARRRTRRRARPGPGRRSWQARRRHRSRRRSPRWAPAARRTAFNVAVRARRRHRRRPHGRLRLRRRRDPARAPRPLAAAASPSARSWPRSGSRPAPASTRSTPCWTTCSGPAIDPARPVW